MSREARFYVPHCVSFLVCAMIILNMVCVNILADRCSELARFDIDEIEDHLSGLNLLDVPTVKMMAAGFKCPVSALPFGALKSDWSRLLLLREAQPAGSIIRQKLVRLVRILVIAYFQMEEHFDVTRSDTQISKLSPAEKMAVTPITNASVMIKPHSSDYSWTIQISNVTHHHLHTYSTSIAPSVINKVGCSDRNCTSTDAVTMRITSHPNGTSNIVPFGVKYQNVTSSSTELGAVTTPYHLATTSIFTVANITTRTLSCLNRSLKNIAGKRSSGRTYNVLEHIKNKKLAGLAIRQHNEINNRGKNRTKALPPANNFWKHLVYPTKGPLTISSITRTKGLNGARTNPRKSRKRASRNSDTYESFGRFYGADKNKKDTRKPASNSSDITIKYSGKK